MNSNNAMIFNKLKKKKVQSSLKNSALYSILKYSNGKNSKKDVPEVEKLNGCLQLLIASA